MERAWAGTTRPAPSRPSSSAKFSPATSTTTTTTTAPEDYPIKRHNCD